MKMRHMYTVLDRIHTGHLLGAGLIVLFITGCASTRDVPFAIYSEPQGAYVMFQVRDSEQKLSDWIYMGNTPLITRRDIDPEKIKKARTITIKVMKEGYFDQTKVWKGKEFLFERKDKGRIFWNPPLVPARK